MIGKLKNLLVQSESLQNHTNQKSYKTRSTYFEKYNKFLEFISENYNLKKLSNVSSKHIYSYVENMKSNGLNNGYIKSSLSAIRFCHSLTNSKNILPNNDKIIEKIDITAKDFQRVSRGASRSWTLEETQRAFEICNKHNRADVKQAIELSQSFGLRLDEAMSLRPVQVKNALKTNYLTIKGKGGKVREIPVLRDDQTNLLKDALSNKLRDDFILVKVGQTVTQAKKSVQNFIYRQRDNFSDTVRISSKEVHTKLKNLRANGQNVKNGEGIGAKLSFHGNRHTYAKDRFRKIEHSRQIEIDLDYDRKHEEYEKSKQKELERERKVQVSKELGHGREEVTDIYLK